MSAGRFSRVRLLLVGVPVMVPSEESKRPFSPICSSSVRRLWLYFWTMASALPAIQTLSWWSTKQPCSPSGSTGGVAECTTLPARSYTTKAGEGAALRCSVSIRLRRLTVYSRSLESKAVPATSPVTQYRPVAGSRGSGLGQNGSTRNRSGATTVVRASASSTLNAPGSTLGATPAIATVLSTSRRESIGPLDMGVSSFLLVRRCRTAVRRSRTGGPRAPPTGDPQRVSRGTVRATSMPATSAAGEAPFADTASLGRLLNSTTVQGLCPEARGGAGSRRAGPRGPLASP